MAAFTTLSDHCLVYNTSKCPQHFGKVIIPAQGYAGVTREMADHMKESQVPILTDSDMGFPPIFKRCAGNGILS
jgi:hypothetical protein